MDIEYKVTAQDQLAIKQARPWVSFWADIKGDYDLGVASIVDPQSSSTLSNNELVSVNIVNNGLNDMSSFELELVVDNESIQTITINQNIAPFSSADVQFSTPVDFSTVGDYNITVNLSHPDDEYDNNNTLSHVLRKVYALDAAIAIGDHSVVCNDVIELDAVLSNLGENTITDVQIEVEVNGVAVDLINAVVNVPFQEEAAVTISIDNNLQQTANNIRLNLLEVNNQFDDDSSNNSALFSAELI